MGNLVNCRRNSRQVGELVEVVVARRLRARGRIDGRGVGRLRDRGDEVLGVSRVLVGRVLARRQPDVADPGEPPVAGVRQVAPGGREGGAGELTPRDLRYELLTVEWTLLNSIRT